MKDNTAKLLGLEDVIIKKVCEDESSHHIELELPRRKHSCPCCGAETELTDTSFDFFLFHVWMPCAFWFKLNPARLKASYISVLLATTSSHLDSNCTS